MTRNIYEQIVSEYYEITGYLTRNNIRGPSNTEIDLLAIKVGDNGYDAVWAEITGSFQSKEKIIKKFSPELEAIAKNLTGKKPVKRFYAYGLLEDEEVVELRNVHGIEMISLEDLLGKFINIAKKNVDKGRYPFSPAAPLRSLLQVLVDYGFVSDG
ncbi:MAG: hypothetical protein ACTSP4_01685 [Candidatus Hodarchaeales archaeon]